MLPKLADSDSCQAVSVVDYANVRLCALCLPKYTHTHTHPLNSQTTHWQNIWTQWQVYLVQIKSLNSL